MERNKKYLAMAAGICIGAGAIIAGIGFGLGGRPGFFVNASGIHSYNSDDNSANRLEKTRLEAFSTINMNIPGGDIHIIPSDDYYIEYDLTVQSGKVVCDVADGTFTMEAADSKWINFFSFGNFTSDDKNYVNLYVPADQVFELIAIDASVGDVEIGAIKAKSMDLALDLGDLHMEDFEGNSFVADLSCGFMKAASIDSKTVVLENDMGDIFCESITAEHTELTLNAGDLDIGTLSTGDLSVENDMGNVSFDRLESTGEGSIFLDCGDLTARECTFTRLEISNNLGNIDLELTGTIDDYQMDLVTDLGSISVPGYNRGDLSSHFVSQNKEGAVLDVSNNCGDISLTFK